MQMPPLPASRASTSSGTLRGWSDTARAEECEKITGARGDVQRLPHHVGADVAEVDEHADAVHLGHDLATEVGEARRAPARRWRSRPRARCRCGSASGSARRAGAASAACRATRRSGARPRRPSGWRSGPGCQARSTSSTVVASASWSAYRSIMVWPASICSRVAVTAASPVSVGRHEHRPELRPDSPGPQPRQVGVRPEAAAGVAVGELQPVEVVADLLRAAHSRSLWPSTTGCSCSSSSTHPGAGALAARALRPTRPPGSAPIACALTVSLAPLPDPASAFTGVIPSPRRPRRRVGSEGAARLEHLVGEDGRRERALAHALVEYGVEQVVEGDQLLQLGLLGVQLEVTAVGVRRGRGRGRSGAARW